MLPLLLNTAMDSILKHRYDKYRAEGTFPPEVLELEKEHIKPFTDLAQLEEWRRSSKSLEVIDEENSYVLSGKIDDVLVEADGRLIPTDYKSSGNPPKEDKQKYYREQLSAYGLMFKKHGFEVSDRAYLLHYFPVDKTNPSLAVEFASHVDRVELGEIDIEKMLKDIVKLLNGPYPGDDLECNMCKFVIGRMDAKNVEAGE